jgi:uncharacterized protein (DUF488 family)
MPSSVFSETGASARERAALPIFTIGHSTHSLAELVRLLRAHAIACLIDVRSAPKSRRMPHFHKEALEQSLPAQEIGYLHLKELGGFRRPARESPNTGWHSGGFQGYADYMLTHQFESALERAQAVAREQRSALMCAEALWWRCHRRLISDALTVGGWRVRHIDADGRLEEHPLTPFAVIEGQRITYPAAQGRFSLEPQGV